MTVTRESLSWVSPGRILDAMKTVSLSDLAKHPQRIAEGLSGKLRLTGARGAILLVDPEHYDDLAATIQMLMRPDWSGVRARIERDRALGRGQDLDEVVKELGLDRPTRSTGEASARGTAARRRAKNRRSAAGSRRRSA